MDISKNKSYNNKNDVLNVWVVSDNKPGHYNQTEGLLQALSEYRKVKLERVPLVSLTKAIKMLFFKSCSKLPTEIRLPDLFPDLIMGTGHQTHMSLLAYRRCFGGKVVVMMSPSIPVRFFDLCFIPRHDKPSKRDNVVETLGAINRVIPDDSMRVKDQGLVLLGGPSKHFKWDSKKVIGQIRKLLECNPETKWIIAGSRRTPYVNYEEIRSRFPQAEMVLPDDVSPDWLPAKTLESGQIWVTADSISMIYEALTSGAKTGLLKLDFEKPTRITNEIDRLLDGGRIRSIDSNSADQSLSPIYEANRCAKLLLEKLGL